MHKSIAQEATAPGSSDEISEIDTVAVTGSARAQRRFDASYAANSLTAEEVHKLAPRSYADLLANVPGIHVESTGGAAIVNHILTEEKGLAEGNTRTDALSGQGSREAIYGRPLFGRNFRLMLNREWK